MSLLRLILREIGRRKLNFGLGLFSIVVAVGSLVGAVAMLRTHDLRTREILAQKEADLKKAKAELEDDYRKITVRMGFNVLILPKDQNLGEFYSESYASKLMPEDYVFTLAKSPIITIQHLLPSLTQKVKWPEKGRTIQLIGIRDEVPVSHADPKKPLQQPVKPGEVVLGAELGESAGLKAGDKVTLMGRELTVARIEKPRGDIDDISAWVDLKLAQELLGKPGQINGILALECNCAMADLPKVRAEITRILPDTQVIEKSGIALARAESRFRAAEEARKDLEREQRNRETLREQRERLAAMLVPLVLAAAALWIGFLALANARERRTEIAVLRAIGMRSSQILWVFFGRALAMGMTGGVLGCAIAWIVGVAAARDLFLGQGGNESVFDIGVAGIALAGAVAVSALGGWIPAWIASQQDPAEILREE